jgi:acyl dehydratase
MRVTVQETRRTKSKPDRGLVHTRGELVNQHEQVAFHQVALNFIRCRD